MKFENNIAKDIVAPSFFSMKEIMSYLKLYKSHSIPLKEEEYRKDRVEETSSIRESIKESIVFNFDDPHSWF